jgi:Family of unknown function (DUF6174)
MSLNVGRWSLAMASALFILVGCSKPTRPPFDRAVLAEGDGSATELHARWAQWRTIGPRSYDYELHRGCFCTTEYVTPAWVEVRDGRVIRANALEGGRALRLELFEPIDSLFVRAIRMAESGGHVAVSYHPHLSYPASLEIGTIANDAGVMYVIPRVVTR